MVGKGDIIVCISVSDKTGHSNEYITIGKFYVILSIVYDNINNPEFFWIKTDVGYALKYPVYLFDMLKFVRNEVIDKILE